MVASEAASLFPSSRQSKHAVDEKWTKPTYEQINEKWSPAKHVVTQS